MRVVQSALAVVVFALVACGGSNPAAPANTGGTPGGTGGTPTGPTSTNQVSLGDASFMPQNILVTPGTTVTWTWSVAVTHNVTFNSSALTSSGNRSSGTFTQVFPNAGSFGYQCTLHAGMTGSVTVQ